ncbi:hypothetical protein L0P88_18025 [Muricauda sp. SCSIO 64092]|uniref:hypothetical protein n=1 Tax=Allomuricauda sp. SCSIO 64092 TaxID=2908842 RepID=UPI001FF18E0F|nr:hypothetical protein [Muricauda sp. SCSIO 64092]UOY05826.1 hypothetical protein L0P88_18025 [Muricauda sp. SCSIO 64092]
MPLDTTKNRTISLIIGFTEYDTKKIYCKVQDQDNSWTVNIDDLGLSYGFYVPYRGKLIIENAEFGRSCVTIPKKIRNVIGNLESITKTRANTLFNLAWKSAIIITESELEGNSKNIIDLKRITRKNLQSTIKSWGGSMATFTVGPCRSGVAVSKARYCF